MNLFDTIQEDFYGRLLASAEFANTAVILQRKAMTEHDLATQLGTLRGRTGKVGTCVLIPRPVFDVVDPDIPGPIGIIRQAVTVLEHPTINASSQGSGKSAEDLALAALQLFHHFAAATPSQAFIGGQGAIVPLDEFDQLSAYAVTVTARLGVAAPAKVARPTITLAEGSATLACATAGAAITYSIDGSYPSEPYAEPFAIAPGTQIRAAASKTALQQSDIATATA